jgi:hypothetical protein
MTPHRDLTGPEGDALAAEIRAELESAFPDWPYTIDVECWTQLDLEASQAVWSGITSFTRQPVERDLASIHLGPDFFDSGDKIVRAEPSVARVKALAYMREAASLKATL